MSSEIIGILTTVAFIMAIIVVIAIATVTTTSLKLECVKTAQTVEIAELCK